MRAAAIILTLALAGCISEPSGPRDGDSASQSEAMEPFSETFTFSIPIGVAAAGDNDPARESWTFEVPDAATEIMVQGEWSCASLCPLHVTIEDGAGNLVRDESSGGWSDTYAAAPGTWTLTIATGTQQGATVAAEGQHSVTVS